MSNIPADTMRSSKSDLMLARRLRREANIKSALVERLVFAGILVLQQYLPLLFLAVLYFISIIYRYLYLFSRIISIITIISNMLV